MSLASDRTPESVELPAQGPACAQCTPSQRRQPVRSRTESRRERVLPQHWLLLSRLHPGQGDYTRTLKTPAAATCRSRQASHANPATRAPAPVALRLFRGREMHAYREVEEVLGDGAGSGKHGNAAVLDLGLTEELDVKEGGEAEGIEADVACVRTHAHITTSRTLHRTPARAPGRGTAKRRKRSAPGSLDSSAAFTGSSRKGTDADLACMVGPRATATPQPAETRVRDGRAALLAERRRQRGAAPRNNSRIRSHTGATAPAKHAAWAGKSRALTLGTADGGQGRRGEGGGGADHSCGNGGAHRCV